MKPISQRRRVTRTGRLIGLAAVAIGASTAALTPTKAMAIDLNGIIGTAMAMQMGAFAYRGAPSGHRSHVASHHDSDGGSSNSGNNGGVERDARDAVTTDKTSKVATRQSAGSSANIRQASERDAAAGQPAASDRTSDDAPTYRPSR